MNPASTCQLHITRTRLTSPSGGACMEKACPAASPPPNAITDLINSRRCILGRLQVSPCTPHCLVDAARNSQECYTDESRWGLSGFRRDTQECFLYILVATTLACGESDPKLLVSIKISNGFREPSA